MRATYLQSLMKKVINQWEVREFYMFHIRLLVLSSYEELGGVQLWCPTAQRHKYNIVIFNMLVLNLKCSLLWNIITHLMEKLTSLVTAIQEMCYWKSPQLINKQAPVSIFKLHLLKIQKADQPDLVGQKVQVKILLNATINQTKQQNLGQIML